jgi:putative GTP pyrophosphokinase
MSTPLKFPGGSKSRVTRAGESVRRGDASQEDLRVIDEWRSAHRSVLNTFQSILRNRTKNKKIAVAQRHKRRKTIFDKLLRIPGMQLVRMDDVAGCRLIFENIESLRKFRADFHKARFRHKRRNDAEKYDYIAKPKATGYRGIHDIYEYNVNSPEGKHLAGLYIEIQYRTAVQHAWATAVEVIGFITESQPKFQKGDARYQRAMSLASEILSRSHENTLGPLPEISDRDLVEEFLSVEKELSLLQTLRALNHAETEISDKKNTILNFFKSGELEIKTFFYETDALRELFDLEKKYPNNDVVLVRAETGEQVRSAFRNYFKDAREFIDLVESGCAKLTGKAVTKKQTIKKIFKGNAAR